MRFDSCKHPSLGGDHQDRRDRLIAQEGQRIALECVLSNRMMAPLIVDHPNRCVPDPLCEAQAYGLRCRRVSLVAQDEQISQARQPIRIDRVDEFKLALRRRLAAGRLAGPSLEVLTVTGRKPADNEGESAIQSMEPRRGIADVSATGQQNAVTYSGIALGGDHGNEAAQRVPNDRVLFGGEELRGADQRLGAFVDPQAEVSERQGG
jgi:hypothetical protein